MKNLFILFLFAAFLIPAQNSFAQNEDIPAKYRAVQGLGYMHTQVSLLIRNWNMHPLSQVAFDEFEQDWQRHLAEELIHDEELAEFMLEDALFLEKGDQILDLEVEEALDLNLAFYNKVVRAVRNSNDFDQDKFALELELADDRLYNTIFPALIR